ncbi:MAG: hypothetical protein HYX52_05750 [Chloroflexi bacterium]|nr:hypothetical protein [Chloroflexota bacterium]
MANGKPGRPPKPRSAGEATDQVDRYLDSNLPEYIRRLSDLARQGDRQALIYLVDRRLGKPVERREDSSDKFVKAIERLARKARLVPRADPDSTALPAGHPWDDPDGAVADGAAETEWQVLEPGADADLPGEGT